MAGQKITERQLAFALCLGIKIPPGTTAQQLSKKIDRAKNRNDNYPPTRIQLALAEAWDIDVFEDTDGHDLGWDLWHTYEDDPAAAEIPDRVQKLAFGGVYESSSDSGSGCFGLMVAVLTLTASITILLAA